jgi:hypothetical protein
MTQRHLKCANFNIRLVAVPLVIVICLSSGTSAAQIEEAAAAPVVDSRDSGFRVAGSLTLPRPADGQYGIDRTGLYYAQFAADGRKKELIQIDPDTGSVKTIASGYDDVGFVAADDRYLLYWGATSHVFPPRIYLLDKASGIRTVSQRFRDGFRMARIERDSVTLVQGSGILQLALPSLIITAQFTKPEVCASANWGDKLVCLLQPNPTRTDRLLVEDWQGKIISRYRFPDAEIHGNQVCSQYNARVTGNTVYVDLGCHSIRAINLISGATKFDLDLGGVIAAMVFFKGTMLVAVHPENSPPNVQAFDAGTGRWLGKMTIPANHLAAGIHRVLAFDDQHWTAPLPATLLAPDF